MQHATRSTIPELLGRIDECMIADRHRLRRRLRDLERTHPRAEGGRPGERAQGPRQGARARPDDLARIVADIDASRARAGARRARIPAPSFPDDLPVSQRRDDIARAIADHQVVIVCGETGSGKTTQLPKICLSLGRGGAGMIGHTQPRRIAARSVATRIAQELTVPLGQMVGYKVRFGDRTSPETLVKVMTDGILLAETQSDRLLSQYDTIIIDEAHERGLNIDFLLGRLKQLLPQRPDLKVIVTSATIDPQRFSAHFGGAPIIEVSGRTYPVEVRHRPLEEPDPDDHDSATLTGVVRAVDELAREGPGDVLVFLPGEREIREAAEALRKHHPPETEILPLYARLSADEQMRVFQAHNRRRIVLATNVAETSLTVPGIRYVVDTGEARISRYSARTKVQRLPIEPVSRASADQRKGRCGRIGPGVCIRLYSEDDYRSRTEFTEPEILRTNLASVILQMKALRLGDVEEFPFVEAPDPKLVRDGYDTLLELGAVDDKGALTDIGVDLARLPIDPRIGRMILAAEKEGALAEVLIIAAALSTQDPRVRPHDGADKADAAHEQFRDETSDFLGMLKLWAFFDEQARKLSGSKLKKLCQTNYLSHMRMREWRDVHQQLKRLATEMGRHANREPAAPAAVHRSILAGLLSSVGTLGEAHEYSGPRGARFHIFPGSALFRSKPKWVMAAELVRTTKLYARTVAKIEPAWIEAVGGHLVQRAYTDPHWDARTAQVFAFERVTLFGLEVIARRRVNYGPIDPAAARGIFIHHALVEGDFAANAPFARHNRALMERVAKLEAKLRRRDLLADATARFAFFDARLPAEVFSGRKFDEWRRSAERERPRLLFMEEKDVLAEAPDPAEASPERHPDELKHDGAALPLEHRFEPGEPADGVTVVTPLEIMSGLPEQRLEWLTPGRLQEKIAALIKALPKDLRRSFVPAPDFAAAAAKAMPFGEGPLAEALSNELARMTGVVVPPEEWREGTLPDHLRMNVRVVGEQGETLAMGRDVRALRAELAPRVREALARESETGYNRAGVRAWDFGDLPERVVVRRAGMAIEAYPALVDLGEEAGLRLFHTETGGAAAMRAGLRRLFALHMKGELESLVEQGGALEELGLLHATIGPVKELKRDLVDLVADRAFLGDDWTPGAVRTKAAFDTRLDEGWNRMGPAAGEVRALALKILGARQAAALRLSRITSPALALAAADVRAQIERLTARRFLASTPYEWLRHAPRYLRAAELRLDKLAAGGAARDERLAADLAPWQRAHDEVAARRSPHDEPDEALERFRWMLEEMRVSLFAQELRTAIPVSAARLEKAWAEVRA